jgi:hypothetical protein
MQNDACTRLYDDALLEAADAFEALPLEDGMDEILAWLADEIAADPRAESTQQAQQGSVTATRSRLRHAPAELRAAVAEH